MARIPNATLAQFSELMCQTGLPADTPKTNAYFALAHAPAAGAMTLRLVLTLLTETALDSKLRELVILRVTQRCDGRYAWVQHVAIAKTAGVNDVQIAALERGEAPANLFTARERTAFVFVDEIEDRANASDATFTAMQEMFSNRELVELLLLIGYFRMISGLMTTLGVEVEAPFGAKILELACDATRQKS